MRYLIFFIGSLLCCWLVAADLTLEILDSNFANQTGARCLDGSPGSFHFKQGIETKKWVIYMEGGGSCATEVECNERALTALGSSKRQNQIIDGGSVFSSDSAVNPGFWNWTHVRLDYCSGDRWAGTRVNASTESWGLYFAGHAIFKSVIEHLITKYNLDDATEILFQGGSAGALGVMSNIDWLNKRLPVPRISLGMNSGWGVDFNPAWSGAGTQGVVDVVFNLYLGHVNEECGAANPTNKSICIFPRYVFAYIPNRLYVINSLLDTVQLAILGFPNSEIFSTAGTNYIISLGYYTKESILENFKRDPRVDGLFVTTCPDHGIGVAINGAVPDIAVADWYYRPKSSPQSAITYDNCAIESVVSLLKANTSLLTDCVSLMQLCAKNSSPHAFEATFQASEMPNDQPEGSTDPASDVPTFQPQGEIANTPTSLTSFGSDANMQTAMSILAILQLIVLFRN